MAQNTSKNPAFHKEIHWSEWNGKNTQKNIGQSKIRNEVIGNGLHVFVPEDDVAHQDVARDSNQKDDGVEHVKHHLGAYVTHNIMIGILFARRVGSVEKFQQRSVCVHPD